MAQANLSTKIYADSNIIAGPSRRSSTESHLSIQDRETDVVRDTSDTDWTSDSDVEYEPIDSECNTLEEETSEQSDSNIIVTEVLEVPIDDDGLLGLADSEQTDSDPADAELTPHDYWQCVQCHATNNNPLYRYCEKCFKERKSLFPPRPKRKRKCNKMKRDESKETPSGSSAATAILGSAATTSVGSAATASLGSAATDSLCFSEEIKVDCSQASCGTSDSGFRDMDADLGTENARKRRASSLDRDLKRMKKDSEVGSSETEIEDDVKLLVKSASFPLMTKQTDSMAKTATINSLREKIDSNDNMCIMCYNEPKTGVFTHGRIAHICCCYKCAIKVWATAKRCPICNCRVNNVLKAVVM